MGVSQDATPSRRGSRHLGRAATPPLDAGGRVRQGWGVNWLRLHLPGLAPEDPDAAPAPVASRWRRALRAGARPEGPGDEPIEASLRLHHRQERREPTLATLGRLLGRTRRVDAARDFTLLFADEGGLVLDRWGGDGFAEHADRLRLQPGSAWDEPTRGTNAIGTALEEGRPVAVEGSAHLARPNRGIVCYGAPVRDPWGRLLGVLDATSFVDRASPRVGRLVLELVGALEQALRVAALTRVHGGIVERMLAHLPTAAWIVAPDGRITVANEAAAVATGRRGTGTGSHVLRRPVALVDVLGLDAADLQALLDGRREHPGVEVDGVLGPDGRLVGYLVVATGRVPAGVRALPARPPPPRSDALARLDPHAPAWAASTLPLVLLGETGTGKERIAREIHAVSPRRRGPFAVLHCGAVTPSLLHSELFGHGPGAFTGATPGGAPGRLEAADGGTLLLDEVGDMPGDVQVALLRFLEDGSFHRVGEARPRRADVRLLAATSRDLESMVAEGRFRPDLFYRLRGATLRLPPVRARAPEDREALCRSLLTELAGSLDLHPVPRLTDAALAWVHAQPWPGNVRELRMALHHAVVCADGASRLDVAHLPQAPPRLPSPAPEVAPAQSLQDAEADALRAALAEADGNVSRAARQLGVARSTVYRMMKRHGVGGG